MRVLLSTIGSRGDVQPLVALAQQLRALGQDVRLCVPPDFAGWMTGLGLDVVSIGPRVRGFTGPWPGIEETVATQFDTLTNAARGCDVIVAATALQIAARSIAEQVGIPYVFAAYSPTVLPSIHHAPPPLPPVPGQPPLPETTDNHELWARSDARVNATFGEALNAHRATRGLAPVDNVRRHMFTDLPWLAADPTLGPWPDSSAAGVVQTGAWILADDRALPAAVERFLDAGDPPIYFGFGSTRTGEHLGGIFVAAARVLGRRAIVSRGWAGHAADDRGGGADRCLTVDEVNLQALLPRVAAAVHHGGAGTTTLTAASGVAQVVVPQVYDQHYWAGRVEQLGIGVAHARGAPAVASLTHALTRAMQPDVITRARTIAAAVRGDGARVAAGRLIAISRAASR